MSFCVSLLAVLCCAPFFEAAASDVGPLSFIPHDDAKALDYGLIVHDDELLNENVSQAADSKCACTDGRCVTRCRKSSWTTEGGCMGTETVCECNPEYGLFNSTSCKPCECGRGINCTFMVLSGEVFSKKCLCPEGYHGGDSYPCEPNCDDDHPCQNGGTCNEGTCMCKRGTSGVFCEEIFWCKSQCKNRLTVDCVYNQEQEYFDCICKDSSLLYDYREEICKPCQCGNGTCKYVGIHDWHCDCAPGHKEFEGKCKPCECGEDGTCEFDGKGLKVCKCKPGCAPRIGICQPCGCGVLNGTEIECDTEKNTKSCHCPKGQEDVNGVCEDVDMCKDSDPCRHPSTKCVVIDGEIACQCRPGYVAKDNRVKPGQPCEDLDECVHGAGCSKNKDTKCVNLPGSYKCECLPGYEPENMKADTRDTQCKRHKDAWMPAGVVLAVVIALLAVGVAVIAIKARRG